MFDVVYISFIFVFFAALTAVLYFKKVKNTKLKYFVYYLIFNLTSETFTYFICPPYNLSNRPVYNIYFIITFLFFLFFYKNLFKKKRNKLIISGFIILFIATILVDLLFIKSSYFVFINSNFIIGNIFLIITLILFLIEIINDDTMIFNIKKTLIFWISVGLLLFYLGIFPVFVMMKTSSHNGYYDIVSATLNVIMYGCFIYGFIQSDKKYNY